PPPPRPPLFPYTTLFRSALTLSGPGKTLTVPRQAAGSLYGMTLDPPALSPGTWQIEGPGGKTIGPFESAITLPPLIRWTNRDQLSTISRSRDQTLSWDPAGYTETRSEEH